MNSATLIADTTVQCARCGKPHPAVIERENGEVFGRVDCPSEPPKLRLSTDAGLFLALRERSRCLAQRSSTVKRSVINLLPITDTCNFKCPVCYAACGPLANPRHLSLAEVMERARKARATGARAVCLTGGEPTMHPDLVRIVRAVRGLGFKVFLITNGYRLGTEPALARALRAAGLNKVDLQFDTLQPEVHQQLRGNTFVQEKINAARNVLAAGIRLGTVTTVTALNLAEVGKLIEFGLSLAPGLKTIMFQTAIPVGRFELKTNQIVDREQILKQVFACRALPGISLEDAWPFPHVEPWGMRVHPDCSVSLVLFRDSKGLHFAREWIDLEQLNERLHGLGTKRHWWARNWGPVRQLLASTRPGRRLAVLGNLLSFLTGRGKRSATLIAVSSACPPGFVDEARLAGCATSELRADGGVSPCACYLAAAPITLTDHTQNLN